MNKKGIYECVLNDGARWEELSMIAAHCAIPLIDKQMHDMSTDEFI